MIDQDATIEGAVGEKQQDQPETAQAVVMVETPDEAGTSEATDSKETPSGSQPERDRSTIRFPYLDLDQGLELAIAIHQHHGLRCSPEQLAAASGHAGTRSGAFIRKVAAAQTFGVIAREGDDFVLTELGKLAVREDTKAAGKAKAFMAVELYKKMYDEFKGGTLPTDAGIESTMVRMGVAPKQSDIARQVFRKSADQAGFFAYGKDRLVAPAALNAPINGNDPAGQKDIHREGEDDDGTSKLLQENANLKAQLEQLKLRPGGTVAMPEGLPAAVIGVLETLPLRKEDTWTKTDLDEWAAMFKQVVRQAFRTKIQDSPKPAAKTPAKAATPDPAALE
jgi:hypothetical protein